MEVYGSTLIALRGGVGIKFPGKRRYLMNGPLRPMVESGCKL